MKDGGPAFPQIKKIWNENDSSYLEEYFPGMTLRDYFASDQKVNLDDAGLHYPDGYTVWTSLPLEEKVKWLAELKYMISDTMIKERTK